MAAGVCRDGRGFVFDRGRYDIQRGRRRDRGRNLGRVAAGRRVVRALTDQAGRTEYNTVVVVSHATTRAQRDIALHLPTNFRSEEHTSELQSPMRISYAVFCLQK